MTDTHNYFVSVLWILTTLIIVPGLLILREAGENKKSDPDNGEQGKSRFPDRLRRFFDWKNVIFLLFITAGAAICGFRSAARPDSVMTTIRLLSVYTVVSVSAITDIRYRIISNYFILFLLAAGVICCAADFLLKDADALRRMLNCLITSVVFTGFFIIIAKITHNGIGFGDIKLIGAIAFVTGLFFTIYTVVVSFFLSAICSLILLIIRKKKIKEGIPFAPFVWGAVLINIILGIG